MMSHASGENILVELEIGGDRQIRTALVQEVQHSPVGGDDSSRRFSRGLDGREDSGRSAAGTRRASPIGVKNFWWIARAEPARLGDRMSASAICRTGLRWTFRQLNIGDAIHVRDIQLPSGVTAKVQLDLTAFSVLAPVVEEEPAPTEAEAAAAGPEVITEKKEEGEAGAALLLSQRKKLQRRKRKNNPFSIFGFGFSLTTASGGRRDVSTAPVGGQHWQSVGASSIRLETSLAEQAFTFWHRRSSGRNKKMLLNSWGESLKLFLIVNRGRQLENP